MKRKLPSRLKSELRNKLLPEIDRATLAGYIAEFLEKPAGKSARGKDFANVLAAYLMQKYSVTDRKSGELPRLIERQPDDLAAFLDETKFKEFQALVRKTAGVPQPISFKKLVEGLLKTPDKLSPSPSKIPLQAFAGIDEATFIDRVTRHFSRGRWRLAAYSCEPMRG